MDYAAGVIFLCRSAACNIKSVLSDIRIVLYMGPPCDMRTVLCDIGVL